jgi:allantoin racemase
MKIWYQSVTELQALPEYRAALTGLLSNAAPSGTQVELVGLDEGTYEGRAPIERLRYPRAFHAISSQIIRKAETADREGFDAFLIGSFVAPGIKEARASVDMPVLSMAEIAILACRHVANSVRLVCLNQPQADLVEDLIRSLGLESDRLEIRNLDLLDEIVLANAISQPAEVVERFVTSCEDLRSSRADLVIPAEGILSMVLKTAGLREVEGRPIVDVFDVALTAAAGAGGLYRRGALVTGRTRSYPRPPI